jgi:hypothetical protein
MRAALDKDGKVLAWQFNSKGFDRLNVESNESKPQDNLFSQLTGVKPQPVLTYGSPQESYKFPAKRLTWEVIPPLLESGSPLRTSHLRDPLGPDIHFASESFMDEVAFAAGMDPVEFRHQYVDNQRDKELITALAEKAGWQKFKQPASRFSIVGVFVSKGSQGVRVAVTGAGAVVFRATGLEAKLATNWSAAALAGATVSADGLNSDLHGSAEYRAALVPVLAARAVA